MKITVLFSLLSPVSPLYSSSYIFRMRCPMQTAEAPSPTLHPTREVSPKVEPPCLYKVEDPNPTPPCPLRVVTLSQTPPHLHTAPTPPHHYLLMMEHLPKWVLGLPLLHHYLLLHLMSPWSLWTRPCRNRNFQTGSTRTWTGAAGNQRAVRTLQRCKKDSRVSLGVRVRSLTLLFLQVMVSTAIQTLCSLWVYWIARFMFCVSAGCPRRRRQPGEVWSAGHHRVHSWAGHGPWWLQRNKVQNWWNRTVYVYVYVYVFVLLNKSNEKTKPNKILHHASLTLGLRDLVKCNTGGVGCSMYDD